MHPQLDGSHMPTFYDQFMGLSVAEREAIVTASGLSLGYVQKHMYVSQHEPKFHFHNAVAMDAASRGILPFHQHTEGVVDWDHVRRSLNRAHLRGQV